MSCLLCQSICHVFYKDERSKQDYFHCSQCDLKFLNPVQRLSESEEKHRYTLHNNDVHDPRYQKFVEPILNWILSSFQQDAKILDFGCGEGPVLAHLLKGAGYTVKLYDPFFANDLSVFSEKYDLVFAIEVFEHLHSPLVEIKRLKKVLNAGGKLAVMTELKIINDDFAKWYYRKDPTHVAFYSKRTCEWIKESFGFNEVQILNDRTCVWGNN